MADVVISASQVIAAGQGYTVPAAQEITVRAVRASFNGAGAAGSYVPMLQILGDSGVVTAECPVGATLAAGASADVSWFPRVTAAAQAAAGGGLQFDTDPQTGDWLLATTTGRNVTGYGIELHDTAAGAATGIEIHSEHSEIDVDAGDQLGLSSGSNMLLTVGGALDVSTQSASFWSASNSVSLTIDGDVAVQLLGAGERIVVFDHTGAAIFAVNEDGSLHGKTGKSLVFDL